MSIKLTLLGTGTFFVTKDLSSSSFLLEADGKKILIDCGPGTLMRLSQVGIRPKDIDFVFITHFHADHTSDLFPFFMNLRLEDTFFKVKPKKFPHIIGPKGVYNFILESSKNYRLLSVEGWEKIKFSDVEKQQKFGNIKTESFKVEHTPYGLDAGGVAYRFTIDGKVITFSGDCGKCSGIEKATKDADIFVCDASFLKEIKGTIHMNSYDIGDVSQNSDVKKVILTHFYPQNDTTILINEIKEKYSGEVIAGKDLMEITL